MAEGTPKNLGAAVKWFKKAARKGSTNAKLYLGLILIYEEQLGQSYWQAAKWLKEAAQDDDPRALRELGLLYASGKGVDEDMAEAQRLMAKAAGMGDKEAEEWLQAHCPQKPEWLQKLVDENS
jgi:TPR repeat protein